MDWNQATEIIKQLAWPLTTLSLAWLLRREVGAVIRRMESAKLPGGTVLSFGNASIDKSSERAIKSVQTSSVDRADWSKTGNLYWLAHDLTWTIDVILRNAAGPYITHGLRQSLHHLNELGLSETNYGQQLKRLYENSEQVLEGEWTADRRNRYACDKGELSGQLGTLAAKHQPDYKPKPSED
jgi:hypothetical protein